jgi:hypothetical protein
MKAATQVMRVMPGLGRLGVSYAAMEKALVANM